MTEALADPWLTRLFRVADVLDETEGVRTLALEKPGDGFAFRPGQFNMLYAFGVGEAAISISGEEPDQHLVHTVRAAGAVSRALARLEPGMQVGVRGPYGRAWPLEACEGRDVLMIAGGIGLAPLRGAVRHVLRHRRRFGRVVLLIGGRSPDLLPYREEVEGWRQAGDIQVEITVDHAPPEWTGHVGVVTTLLAGARLAPENTVAMICGPEIMIRFAVESVRALGLEGERVFVSLERNMKCAVGHCGRCQLGPHYVCKDGPVFAWPEVGRLLLMDEM